jgi:alkaline phosphatase D
MIWLQTISSSKVNLIYYDANNPSETVKTPAINTEEATGFTAHFVIPRLEPGKTYFYDVFVDGKKVEKPYKFSFKTQKLWEWREDPPDFSFITGSCAYINDEAYDRPGKPYGGQYEIFNSIVANRGDFMLWLGDNVYFREAEWSTRDGMIYRYTHSRANKEMQEMLSAMHHYAIWDDHDYGNNDSDRSWRNKKDALDVFKMFWGNPGYGVDEKPGVTTSFNYSDVDFFLLDNRYNRTPNNKNNGDLTILGKDQREWLIDALVSSKATFKIVCMGGQFLNSAKVLENYANYELERQWILDQLETEKISGVIFLSGDRHSSELDIMPREKSYPLHEFTISSFTAGPSNYALKENNIFRKEGTLLTERNFAKITVSGKKKERILKCSVYNVAGEEKWSYSISESQLRYPGN